MSEKLRHLFWRHQRNAKLGGVASSLLKVVSFRAELSLWKIGKFTQCLVTFILKFENLAEGSDQRFGLVWSLELKEFKHPETLFLIQHLYLHKMWGKRQKGMHAATTTKIVFKNQGAWHNVNFLDKNAFKSQTLFLSLVAETELVELSFTYCWCSVKFGWLSSWG